MTHLLQELEDITGLKLSVLKKAVNQASHVYAVENDEQDASNPLEGRVAGPVRDYGSVPNATASTQQAESDEPIINWSAMPEASVDVPGSTIVGNLKRGDKLKFLQDTGPNESYVEYENNFIKSVAASTGWSDEMVWKKFSNNYSASRAILILIWRQAQIEIQEMASDFLDPVYEMWLSEEIAAGRVSAPGWSDYRMRAAWLNCEWAGAPMPNIDPLKTAEADRAYVELGAQTLDDVARNYNGSSGKANRMKNARQYEELPTPPWPRAPIQNVQPEEMKVNGN
jgi:capsid protein